jgi:hypothetical protein
MGKVLFEDDENELQPTTTVPNSDLPVSPSTISSEEKEANDWAAQKKESVTSDPDHGLVERLMSLFTDDKVESPETSYKGYEGPILPEGALPEHTASMPSMGFFDRFSQSVEIEEKGPSSPSGAINRMSGSIQKYASEVQKETGINPLEGLDLDQLSRNTVGAWGNMPTWSTIAGGPFKMASSALKALDHKAGTGLFSDQSVIFEKRLEALKEQFPESKFAPTTLGALKDQSVKDYNGLLAQDAISNDRNSWASTAGAMLGGLYGFAKDPVNLASVMATRGSLVGIKGILQAAGMNAGASAITSLPGMIEGREQGIESANLSNYALMVGAGAVLGGTFAAIGEGVKAGVKALAKSDVGAKYFSFKPEMEAGKSSNELMRSGADTTVEALRKSADDIDLRVDETKLKQPHTAEQLKLLAETQRVTADAIANNPYGKSTEAVDLFTETMSKNREKFLNGDYDMELPPTLFDAPELPNRTMQEYRNARMEGLSHTVNNNPYRERLGNAINMEDSNVGAMASEAEGILNQTTQGSAPSTTSRLSTISGNYLPKIEKNGEVKVFNTLDEVSKAKDAISDPIERARTAIGGTSEGKFTLVEDTSARQIGVGSTEEAVQEIIERKVADGSYNLNELSVVKTPQGFKVVANASEADLERISKFPDYVKLDAGRRAPRSLGVTEEGRQSQLSSLDKAVQEQRLAKLKEATATKAKLDFIKEKVDADLQKTDKYLEKHFEYADQLPDDFKYSDSVWGDFTKLDFKEKLSAIKKAISEFKDCAGE